MDVRQFKKNRGAVNKKQTVPKTSPNPKDMKTFSGGFSKAPQEPLRVRKTSEFGICSDQKSTQVGREKVLLEWKQEQKRRIAIEALKLAEQRKLAMMKRNNVENEVVCPVVVKPEFIQATLFSLDVNQPGKVKTYVSSFVPKLPPIKETAEVPRGRPIVKGKALSVRDMNTKTVVFQHPTDLVKGLKFIEPAKKKIVRYSAKELMNMNPMKSHPKFKAMYA